MQCHLETPQKLFRLKGVRTFSMTLPSFNCTATVSFGFTNSSMTPFDEVFDAQHKAFEMELHQARVQTDMACEAMKKTLPEVWDHYDENQDGEGAPSPLPWLASLSSTFQAPCSR